MASIAVALSGGGYRAAMFGLGVLLYPVDAAKNREVTSISSVSGGSIINAFVGQMRGYHQRTSVDFWQEVAPLARTIAHKTLWLIPRTLAYLLLLLLSFIGIVYVCFWIVPWYWWAQMLLFLILLLPWGWLLQQRGAMAGRSYGTHLFSPDGCPTRLASLEAEIDHVICATHLDAGEHFYFSGSFVYGIASAGGNLGGYPCMQPKLGPEVAARLAYHGYVLAMANLHVILDFPLLEIPDMARFTNLVC
jgi:hypothetical protein